jgi:hypothetical protein
VITAGQAGDLRDRVIDRLVGLLPGLSVRAAQDVLVAAQADHGRALRELDALLREQPDALAVTPAASRLCWCG